MDAIIRLSEGLQYVVSGAVGLCGGWFLLATKGLFGWEKRVWEALREKPAAGEVSPRRALSLALAGTLGVGNIAGVGSALSLGGPGALFWMALSAIFAMFLKYAETLLAMLHRNRESDGSVHGGAMYCMPRRWGCLFSLLCLGCSLTIGNGMQVRAVVSIGENMCGDRLPVAAIVGGCLTLLLLAVLLGGKRRLFALAAGLVPAMTVGYLLLCLLVLWKNAASLPGALRTVFISAFHPAAACGGVVGYTVFSGIRYGFIRGLVSNEAGAGTAPIAHAAAEETSPVTQGCMGMLEVAIDTLLLCSLSALCILVTGGAAPGEQDGMQVALTAFTATLGPAAGWLLFAAVFLFAFATAVSWSFYGREALHFLTDRLPDKKAARCEQLYLLVYSLLALPAAFLSAGRIWQAADLCIVAMTLLNLCALWKRREEILAETRRAGLLH